jgi:hypothetical protein
MFELETSPASAINWRVRLLLLPLEVAIICGNFFDLALAFDNDVWWPKDSKSLSASMHA